MRRHAPLGILLLASLAGGVPAQGGAGEKKAKAAWTIALYFDADNDLEAALLRQLEGVARVPSTDAVNVVAFVDRHDESGGGSCPAQAQRYSENGVANLANWHGARTVLVERGSLSPTGAEAPADMGDASTLRSFLAYVRGHHDAERWALVLNDHGGGPSGLCVDGEGTPCEEAYASHLSLEEVAEALAGAGFTKEAPLDVLMFDACSMATVEVLATVAPYARHAVAAETVIDDDFRHGAVLDGVVANPSIDGRDLAIRFAAYHRKPGAGATPTSGRMTAFDLGAPFDRFRRSLHDLADALIVASRSGAGDATWARFARARLDSPLLLFGVCRSSPYNCDVRDLGGLARRLGARRGAASAPTGDRISECARCVGEALRDCVLCYSSGSDSADLSGLSIYVPCDLGGLPWVELPPPLRADPWAKFLAAFQGPRAGPGVALADAAAQPSRIRPRELVCVTARATRADGNPVDLDWLGPTWFVVEDVRGKEILRLPVEPEADGTLRQWWRAGGFAAGAGKARIGLGVSSVRDAGGGLLVADAPVLLGDRAGLLHFTVSEVDHAWIATPLYVTTLRNGWRAKVSTREAEETLRARRRGSAEAEVGLFFEGTGPVPRKDLAVAYESLSVGTYRVGFAALQLDGEEKTSFTTLEVVR